MIRKEEVMQQEAALFEIDLAVLSAAYELRNPDARARANRMLLAIDDQLIWAAALCRVEQTEAADKHVAELQRRLSLVVDLTNANENKNLNSNAGATPEVKAKPARRYPLVMLEEKKFITVEQARAAIEIAWVFGQVERRLWAKTGNLQLGVAGGQGGYTDRFLGLHTDVYLPWTKDMHERWPGRLGMVIQIVVDGHSIDLVSGDHHIGWETCKDRLKESLDLYVIRRDRYEQPKFTEDGNLEGWRPNKMFEGGEDD